MNETEKTLTCAVCDAPITAGDLCPVCAAEELAREYDEERRQTCEVERECEDDFRWGGRPF